MSDKEASAKSIIALKRIFETRGLRGIWFHLLNIYFDVIRGIDTVDRYQNKDINNFYATSTQSSIKKSLEYTIKCFIDSDHSKQFNFIELGAGKGKVIIILKDLLKNHLNVNVDIIAIELDKYLCKILTNNLLKSGFSLDVENKLNFNRNSNSSIKIKAEVFPYDIEGNKFKEIMNTLIPNRCNIFYCLDALPKRILFNTMEEIIKIKSSDSKQRNLLIYANPRFLDDLLLEFRDAVSLLTMHSGAPQESYAVLDIK